MLSSNRIPYDLSRRRSDQFYAKVERESPFDTIVFLFKTEVSGVSILKDRAGVSLFADVSLLYTQINSRNFWQFSCCDKKGEKVEFFSTFRARFHCKDIVNFRCGLHSCMFPRY